MFVWFSNHRICHLVSNLRPIEVFHYSVTGCINPKVDSHWLFMGRFQNIRLIYRWNYFLMEYRPFLRCSNTRRSPFPHQYAIIHKISDRDSICVFFRQGCIKNDRFPVLIKISFAFSRDGHAPYPPRLPFHTDQ